MEAVPIMMPVPDAEHLSARREELENVVERAVVPNRKRHVDVDDPADHLVDHGHHSASETMMTMSVSHTQCIILL